ncbi:MAG: transglutaminase family protein [Nitrospirota bacterium]|nr:transglutaminase family protein [Nitrospirota bacterium]
MARRSKERGLVPVELAKSLLHQVYAHMRYQTGATHVGTTAAKAFEKGAGVWQDYAHVMLSLCRLAGLPARYISGYLPGEGQMHAWVEVLLPVGSHKIPIWVAYDPTHQRRCDERYITVAIGRDYQDIAPTSGYYLGASANSLSVTVSVVMETHTSGERWLNPQMMFPEALTMIDEVQQQ